MSKLLPGLILWLLTVGAPPAWAEPLSLDECLHLAQQQNVTLQAARINPQLAAEKVRETRSVFLPRVDLDAGYTAQANPQEVLLGGASAPTQEQNYLHMALDAEQLLYDFGRSSARLSRAEAETGVAEAELASREQDLFLRTTRTYFQILAAQQLLLSADEEVALVDAHRKEVESLYEQGVVTRNDLLQAAVRLASARQEQLVRQGLLDNAWLALNYLTGRPDELRSELEVQRLPEAPLSFDAANLDQQPELLAQQQRVVVATAGVEERRSDYRPELFARLGADYVENSYVKEQTIYRATLGMRVNLYDGQASTSQLRQSLLALDREKLQLADLRHQTQRDYRQANNDARVARSRIDVAEAAILQAEENLRINRERYREQVGTATEVLDAQTLLTESRGDLALAQYDYQVAVARVRRVTGNL